MHSHSTPSRSELLAWAAGLFEGEGWISVMAQAASDTQCAHVGLAMTDKDTVDRFASIIGVGTVCLARSKPGHKPLYRWRVCAARQVEDVLETLRPWLSARRLLKVEEALAAVAGVALEPWQNRITHCPFGHPYSEDNTYRYTAASGAVSRQCRACRRRRDRERIARLKGV